VSDTQKKSKGLPPHLIPGNPGNAGGPKGRSGRRPKVWKEFCGKALKDPLIQQKALELARKGDVPMLKLMVDSAEGAPAQKITLQSDASALDQLFDRLRPKGPGSN